MKKILLIISFILLSFAGFSQTYYLVENGEVTRAGLPTSYTSTDGTYWYKNYRTAPDSVWYADGFRISVMPEYNPSTQYLGALYYDVGNDKVTRQVIDKSPEQIAAEQEAYLQAIESQLDIKKVKYLLQKLAAPLLDTIQLDSTAINAFEAIYDQWRIGKYYEANAVVVKDSNLFRVIQAHTSQADWLPENTPALYTPFTPAGQISDWVQPTGAQDAYQTGDKVRFNGAVYESLIDANVWSPAAYPAGWVKI